MKCLRVSLLGDISVLGYYAGGARFEYGEQQQLERLTPLSKIPKKTLETGGEI